MKKENSTIRLIIIIYFLCFVFRGLNILHITSLSGTDQLQVMRIAIAQTLSFLSVLFVYWKTKANQKNTYRA